MADTDAVTAERARLGELRLLALEDRATLLVASGAPAAAVGDLEALTVQHPLRERPWTLLAVAQARTGRQADALATLERLRRTLDDQLGLEPSPAVRDLQTAILRQEAEVSTRLAAPEAPGPELPPEPRIDVVVPDWPLVGREAELGSLLTLLDEAERRRPRLRRPRRRAGRGEVAAPSRALPACPRPGRRPGRSAAARRRRTHRRCGRGPVLSVRT